MVAVWIILGICIGAVIGYLIAELRARGAATEAAIAKEQARLTAQQLGELQEIVSDLRLGLGAEQQDRAALDAQLVAANEMSEQNRLRHTDALEQLRSSNDQLDALRDQYHKSQNELATANANLGAEQKTLTESREQFAEAESRLRETIAEQSGQTAQKVAGLQSMLDELRARLSVEQQERATLHAQLIASNEAGDQHRFRHADAMEQLRAANELYEALRLHHQEAENELATKNAMLEAERKSLVESREHFSDAKNRVREAFAELSTEALAKNRQQFFDLAQQTFKTLQTEAAGSLEEKKSQIGAMLQPVSTQLESFKQSVDKLEAARGEAFTHIQRELAAVAATQQNLSVETRQLVTALRRSEGRGRWGEVALERLFEASGMASHVIYNAQETLQTDDGDTQRPDVIITLPKNRRVIVDSKAVFAAFLDAVDATDDVARAEHLNRHVKQVRSRVDDLSNKAYWKTAEQTTEFVIMFLPIEAQLYAAVERDRELVEYALHKRVLIASPTTLMGVLQILEHSWQQDQVEENARKIVDAAKILYERLATVSKNFDKLGRALGSATNAYNDTLASLETRLLPQARKITKMGLSKKSELSIGKMLETPVRELKSTAWPEVVAGGHESAATDEDAEVKGQSTLKELSVPESAALGDDPLRSAEV